MNQVHGHVFDKAAFELWYNRPECNRKHPLTGVDVVPEDVRPSHFLKSLLEATDFLFKEKDTLGGGVESTPIHSILQEWVRYAPDEEKRAERLSEMRALLMAAEMD